MKLKRTLLILTKGIECCIKLIETMEVIKVNFYQFYEKYFPFWNKFNDTDKEFLCQNSDVEHFEKEQVVHNNMECSGLYIVKNGKLRLYMLSEEGFVHLTSLTFFFSLLCDLILQIVCVIVPIGQKAHQLRGLNKIIAIKPSSVEVSIMP